MDKPTNGYYVTIVKFDSNTIVKAIGPYTSIRQADKADDGVNRNLNHVDYYTNTAWFGPDIEPTEH